MYSKTHCCWKMITLLGGGSMGLGLLDSLVSLEILSLRWVNLAVAVLVKKKNNQGIT